jgi:hypothetical protein
LRLTRRGKVVFSLLPLLFLVGVGLALPEAPTVSIDGVAEGATLGAAGAAGVELTVATGGPLDPADVRAWLDGREVEVAVGAGGVLVRTGALAEGRHAVSVEVDRDFPFGSSRAARSFTVDATLPGLEVVAPTAPVSPVQPVVLRLAVDDSTALVQVEGRPAEVVDGVVEWTFPVPPKVPVRVEATDPAGNTATLQVEVQLALAGAPGGPPIRGVHASGYTWASPELRGPILEMIREGRINTVELDLKDEAGEVWYDTGVALAHEIGAVTVLYDLAAVVEDLHALGVRVIGRLVNFRDPLLAAYAVETGRMDWVVQNPDGTAFGKYGGFTNLFNDEVWEYNIALAEEAARVGIDDILYDYVRRPDEDIERMRFPGQEGTPEDAIVGFLEASRERIHAAGARLGASVFGVAATRPLEIAQDIPRMSRHVDYIAPMLYPSHWGPGEYGVANPNAQPYDIVHRSLLDFGRQMAGTGATLVAWLQDFSLGVEYGPAEVRAQIQAAEDAGVPDFLLWDAATTYTAAALDPAAGE